MKNKPGGNGSNQHTKSNAAHRAALLPDPTVGNDNANKNNAAHRAAFADPVLDVWIDLEKTAHQITNVVATSCYFRVFMVTRVTLLLSCATVGDDQRLFHGGPLGWYQTYPDKPEIL